MPYAHRSVHDADGQTMEWPGWPSEYADSRTLERLVPLSPSAITPGGADVVEAFRSEHRNPTRRTRDGVEFISPRDWAATGSLIREEVISSFESSESSESSERVRAPPGARDPHRAEDVGGIVGNRGDEICQFSSGYHRFEGRRLEGLRLEGRPGVMGQEPLCESLDRRKA